MPGTYRLAVAFALALALALAACTSTTPPPTNGDPDPDPDPDPLQPVPITALAGTAEGYEDGAANVAMLAYDSDAATYRLGSSVGSIDADGDFSLTLNDGFPSSVLFTTNADEVTELYGECLSLSRSWRIGGGGGPEVFTGDDIETRTTVAYLRPVDGDDLASTVGLSYIRPVPADSTVVLTVRLPIEITQVTAAGETEPDVVEVTCGDDVTIIELVQGWYWTVTKGAVTDATLPNGDEVYYQIVTRFYVGDAEPGGLRWLVD